MTANYSDHIYYFAVRSFKRLWDFYKKRQILLTPSEISKSIESCNSVREFDRFVFRTSPSNYPKDPNSEDYFKKQRDLYLEISGRGSYSASECEKTQVSEDTVAYPFSSKDSKIIADHLLADSFLLKNMELLPGQHILEFGSGWGRTTELFLKSGFRVTVVDISEDFCAYLSKKFSSYGDLFEVHCQDMLGFSSSIKFDAMVFNESFHHCSHHLGMIKRFPDLLESGGKIYFNSEPITWKFPSPWGLRLDGQSLWAIHTHGWYELGFNIRYFKQIMSSEGWRLKRTNLHGSPMANLIIAQR